MTTKTITTYICERCGEETEKIAYTDWCIVTTQAKNGWSTHLCPSCSKRALEKPKGCAHVFMVGGDGSQYWVCRNCGEFILL